MNEKDIRFMNDAVKFMVAADEALDERDFGTVEFSCPLCGGLATAKRFYSVDGDGKRVRSQVGNCGKCGFKHS